MSLYGPVLVILLTALVIPLGIAWWMGRDDRAFARTIDTPSKTRSLEGSYGPFPVDTGPLLIVSETTAAGVALDRWTRGAISETDWLIEAGERAIGPVQP